ncbi:C4-dicarboxylate ABC transporter permease [Bacillus sp. LK10]|uniref:TRAP transporter large permease subunit n=1 Tax=Bacillus sp. LK10 TaxID=1628211 RepID=UPI00064F3938|nr:TRAP transporter large permease subunit [Bacillus sp. LK10]KML19960.1 C4-dicarboxylate ABC transporter permease [Bacillus stratosphericus]KML60209.1 C4-dicarboxylate ABC transporter permease [Bacillus stratosphericus]KMN32569.1 C4-dicarboxylate ABC transporter permease [Bacillus stratosphericus]KMN75946.1 C4-dicarboxylate ABC transporter permease [Bacillus sp. LK10]
MGFIALIVFIAVIIIWNVMVKRNMGEAMLLGFIATTLFGGLDALRLFWDGLIFASTYEVLYAAVAFVFMAYLIEKLELIHALLRILNSVVGKLPGGAAYMSTLGSAVLGALSGSNSANTAATGSITASWMIKSGWSRTHTATILAGNGGLGAALPPNSSMFIMLGFAPVAALVSEGDLYIALLIGGLYQVVYRFILVYLLVKKNKIQAMPPDDILPFWEAVKQGWKSIFIFFGALIPIMITIGPLANYLKSNPNIGPEAMDQISLITWIPILMILISLTIGRKKASVLDWSQFFKSAIPKFTTIGALMLFAVAASQVLAELGLAEDLTQITSVLAIPKWLMVLIVGVLVTLVAGPLSSTATLTAVGLVSFSALISVGVAPVVAVVAILAFSSTEGASPPASGSIFIASGLAGARPEKTFIPLILYYMLPIVGIGWLIGMEILPV